MTEEKWTTVDRYITDLLVQPDAALDAALLASAEAGLPQHNVSANEGKLLLLLAQIRGRALSWRSARWAATARSGWRGRCLPMAASSRWKRTRSTPRSLGPTSRGPVWPKWLICASGAR
jgi:hypothetical protein